MDKKITKRLSRDTNYKKSGKSYQEKLSPSEIKKKLEEYSQVEDIRKVSIGTHMRYFTFNPKTGEKQFRLGGFLSKIDPEMKYVILQNGSFSWSVQLSGTVFFKKMSFTELKEELKEKIYKKFEKQISNLKKENFKLKETLKEIKNQIKN
jgi:mannose-1-phosphate guanylyltransferase